jgi:hypothetical protein
MVEALMLRVRLLVEPNVSQLLPAQIYISLREATVICMRVSALLRRVTQAIPTYGMTHHAFPQGTYVAHMGFPTMRHQHCLCPMHQAPLILKVLQLVVLNAYLHLTVRMSISWQEVIVIFIPLAPLEHQVHLAITNGIRPAALLAMPLVRLS